MENNDKPGFKPYISPKDFIPEFTLKAVVLGSIFGIIFGAVMLYSAYASLTSHPETGYSGQNTLALKLKLQGSYPGPNGPESYVAQNVPAGFSTRAISLSTASGSGQCSSTSVSNAPSTLALLTTTVN